MSSEEQQKHVHHLLQENAPEVEETELLPILRVRLANKRMRPAHRSRSRRAFLVASASLVVAAAVAVGVYEAVVHLGTESPVIVITDDPAGISTTLTSLPAGVSVSPTSSTLIPSRPVDQPRPYGFDVRQPFIDYAATEALGDPASKIVTTWVAVGNRQDIPLSFKLSDLTLIDAYDPRAYRGEPLNQYYPYYFTETVAPIWSPALEATEIAPGEVVGGYVSWKVPWYVWPRRVFYAFPGPKRLGTSQGWGMPIFSDLNAGNRSYLAIGKLLYRGVVEGSKDEPFRPDDPITVAEFAKMAVISAAPYNKATFSYPAGYIEEATSSGLASWGPKTAAQALTRLEVALTVAQIAREELSAPPADYSLPFTDVPESAKDDLALLAYNGVISGTRETSFNPEAECLRGQACRMLALVLDPRYREEESRATTSAPSGATTTTG